MKPLLLATFSTLKANRLVALGSLLVAALVLLALAAPALTQARLLQDPKQQAAAGLDEDGMPRSPGGAFTLGTDNLGRDVLARVVHGARVSLPIGLGAMATATVLGVLVGLLAGFYGGRLDTGVIFVENVFALPGIGTLAVQSVFNLDVPMIMGVVLFSAAIVVGANLVVDFAYRWIDPRITAAR